MKIITSKLFHEYLNNKKIYIFHDYDINLQKSIKNLTENGWCSAGGGLWGLSLLLSTSNIFYFVKKIFWYFLTP